MIETTLVIGGMSEVFQDDCLKADVVIPPPPTPAKARDAISSSMFLDRPQNKHPNANIEYAARIQVLRPKMSLSFPYNGLEQKS
jgi:hypothetical protein